MAIIKLRQIRVARYRRIEELSAVSATAWRRVRPNIELHKVEAMLSKTKESLWTRNVVSLNNFSLKTKGNTIREATITAIYSFLYTRRWSKPIKHEYSALQSSENALWNRLSLGYQQLPQWSFFALSLKILYLLFNLCFRLYAMFLPVEYRHGHQCV